MICPRCGNKNDDDARFCDACGAPLTGAGKKKRTKEEPKKDLKKSDSRGTDVRTIRLRCKNCDGPMEADSEGKFMICPYCGTKELIIDERKAALAEMEVREKARQAMEEKESRTSFEKGKFRIVLIVFAIFASVFGVMALTEGYTTSGIIGITQAALNMLAWLMGMRIIRTKRLNLYRFPFILGLLLILPYLIFFGNDVGRIRYDREYKWEDSTIASQLEQPSFGKLGIYLSSDRQFAADVDDVTQGQYREYLTSCKEKGFTVDSFVDPNGYTAFDEAGTKLETHYYEYMKQMSIRIIAPLQMRELIWPSSELADLLPRPDTDTGLLDRENNSSLVIYAGGTSRTAYADYVQQCMDAGFNVDYRRNERTYYAENEEGCRLSVDYYGFDIMLISLYRQD